MEEHAGPVLIVKTRGGDCSVIHEGVSLLGGSHNNVRKLFRKLVESAGIALEYGALELELYGNETQGSQGAYNTKNAVRSLRSALFPLHAPDGQQKWRSQIEKNGKTLLLLEKTHASRICLSLPCPASDLDVTYDLEPPREASPILASSGKAPFTVPMSRSRHFFGRDGFLAELHAYLASSDSACAAVCGAGGMGKTQLAAEYAHAYRDSYPSGVFWIDAKDLQSVQEEYGALSREREGFRAPPELSAEERARHVRECFQQLDRPSLLVLDNLILDHPELVPKFSPYLPVTGRCRILATTRRPSLLKSWFHVMHLPELDVTGAEQALQACCTIEETSERLKDDLKLTREAALARESAAVQGIIDDLNQRLPLALTLIAFYVDQRQITFEECRQRLAANSLNVFGRAEVPYSIHAAFKVSRNELFSDELRILAAAACFARRGISQKLLSEVTAIEDEEAFDAAVARLRNGSFIAIDKDKRITLHDVLRDITFDQIESGERNALLTRTAETLLACLEGVNEAMTWEFVHSEIAQCRAVVENCRRHSLHAPLAALLCELGNYYRLHDEMKTAIRYFDEAARIVAAHIPHAVGLLAKCKMNIAVANSSTPEAVRNARQALALVRTVESPDDGTIAAYYNAVGFALKYNGHPWRALPFYCCALRLTEAAHGRNCTEAGEYLNNIGLLYEDLGDLGKAVEYLTEAREILQQAYGPEHRRLAIIMNNLGRIQCVLGDSDQALQNHLKAQSIHEAHFGRENKDFAMSLYFAAMALAKLGRDEEAKAEGRTALDVLEKKYGSDDSSARRVRLWLESMF